MMRRLVCLVVCVLALSAPAVAQVVQPSPQSISVQDSGTACANAGTCASWGSVNQYPSLTYQLTGTCGTCTVTFEGTADGQSWFAIFVTKLGTGVMASTTTTTGQYAVVNVGLVGLRARLTARSSGGFNVTLTRGLASAAARLFDLTNVTGVLAAVNGGTGLSSYAVGALLYADTTTTLATLADVAVGAVLVSGGVGVAPAYSASPVVTRISFGTGDNCLARSGTKTVTFNDCAGGVATFVATGAFQVTQGLALGGATANLTGTIVTSERATPAGISANQVVIFAKDNGGGKTQLCALFSTGVEQCFATEP